tara:strand:- start:3876 stop:4058 length:183 start_codon:yes stop_codon:yes gene_type:complete
MKQQDYFDGQDEPVQEEITKKKTGDLIDSLNANDQPYAADYIKSMADKIDYLEWKLKTMK